MVRAAIAPRDRRTLLVGLLVVSSLLVVGKGVPAWRRWDRAERDGAAEHLRQLAIARQGTQLLGPMHDTLAARRARTSALLERLVTARSIPQASAALATVLSADASDAPLKVFTLGVRGDSAARNGFAHVEVRVSAEGDVRGLSRFVRRVELDSLLLAVRELTIGQPDPGGPDSKAETLRLDMLVEALARIDGGNGRNP